VQSYTAIYVGLLLAVASVTTLGMQDVEVTTNDPTQSTPLMWWCRGCWWMKMQVHVAGRADQIRCCGRGRGVCEVSSSGSLAGLSSDSDFRSSSKEHKSKARHMDTTRTAHGKGTQLALGNSSEREFGKRKGKRANPTQSAPSKLRCP
jgi:hypothetical protein